MAETFGALTVYRLTPTGWLYCERDQWFFTRSVPAGVQNLYNKEGWLTIVYQPMFGAPALVYPIVEAPRG